MKKLLLIALLLTFATGIAVAQQNGGPGSQGGGQGNAQSGNSGNSGSSVDRLTERLGLNEEQAIAIASIFEDNQLLREQERALACELADEARTNTHAQILEVLTLEQRDLFEQQHQERQAMKEAFEEYRAERGFGGDRRGPRGCDQ
jgi:Spy/CpxP family protein refolding chaperone